MRQPSAVAVLTDFELNVRHLAMSGMTPREIALRVGTSVTAVQRALRAGRAKMGYETKAAHTNG